MDDRLNDLAALWRDVNYRVGQASGSGNPPDPWLFASLLDARAGLWIEIGVATPLGLESRRPNTQDIYATACHSAGILDLEQAAQVRFAHRIPTLHPGSMAARLNLSEARCGHCGRPWSLDTEDACERCPALLWGIPPANADEVGKYPAGVAWVPGDATGEDEG